MSEDVRWWEIDRYRTAYASGATVVDVVERVLALVGELPAAVLIGEPLADRAMADARALAAVPPDSLPLYGVPYLVKDNVDVAGVPTTAGCPGFAFVPTADATVVARLRAAGAIVVGKTNLDQFATGLVGTRSPHGSPPNVLRGELVPGGSSSGSAVAVALGAVPFSIGTDTAGSGRVPAALNGIVGLKPTLGRVSLAGIVPAVRRLDCPSVFARSVGDAQAVVAAIAGPDPRDALTRRAPDLRPMRWPPVIGVPTAWPAGVELSDEMASWFAAAVERLRAIGATVVDIDIAPALELGAMLYGSAVVAERAAAVGHAVDKGVDGLDPTVASIIADSMLWSAVDAYRAEYRLADLRAAFEATWDGIDVLALPTTAFLPTRVAVRADPIGVNRAVGSLTTFVNLADAACVVVPMEPGVPGGLQLVARAWRDDELAGLAASYVAGVLTAPAPDLSIVVVGAHLDGLPLNGQLTERGAWLRRRTTTAAAYRLYELAGTVPPKPGLRRVGSGGAAIEVEVWAIGAAELGSFVGEVPAPLGIGTVELADGTWEHGFICEGWALEGARDITDFGGWRAFLKAP